MRVINTILKEKTSTNKIV